MEQGSTSVVTVWEEIRKALDATVLTREQGETPLHIRTFSRETDPAGASLRQWYTTSTVSRGVPFSAQPVSHLVANGFIVIDGGLATLHGPDAELLLSEEFVDRHCYHLVPGEDGTVGLAFEPVPGQRRPDITGTLWVDRATSALRHLDFRYTAIPPELEAPMVGGRLEFTRLDDGGWIIHAWHIRSPRIRPSGSDRPRTLVGYVDQGGVAAVAGDGETPMSWAVLQGQVHDSVAGRGLPGVMIVVPTSGDSIVTDETGRFSMIVAASGDLRVTARHPRLGLLGEPTMISALLSIGDTTVIDFAMPSLESFVARRCGSARRGAAVVGLALDPDGTPARDVDVQFWTGPLGGRTVPRSATVAADGQYALCDVPTGTSVTIRLYRGSSPVAEEHVTLGLGEHRWMDMRIRAPEFRTGQSVNDLELMGTVR